IRLRSVPRPPFQRRSAGGKGKGFSSSQMSVNQNYLSASRIRVAIAAKHQDDKHFPLAIIALAQAVLYAGLWLWNEYVASYMTLILPSVLLVLLILSLIADWIEPSRIPRWYLKVMLISILVPVLTGIALYLIYGGRLDWLQGLPK